MALITIISTVVFIFIVHLFFYRKLLLVKKYNGYEGFAKFCFKDQVHINWRLARKNKAFTAEWKRVMPKYYILFALGILQFVAVWILAINCGVK